MILTAIRVTTRIRGMGSIPNSLSFGNQIVPVSIICDQIVTYDTRVYNPVHHASGFAMHCTGVCCIENQKVASWTKPYHPRLRPSVQRSAASS